MSDWFFRYSDETQAGGFDIREIEGWYSEPDLKSNGYRVYLKSGKSHFLTEAQLGGMVAMLGSLS
jgi:hypothetical protein